MARGRPALPLGTAGAIRVYPITGGYLARTLVRDYDGVTRSLKRSGSSKGAARSALAQAVRDRHHSHAGDIGPDMRVDALAQTWWESAVVQALASTTRRNYRGQLDRHIIPSLGGLRVRELTVGTVNAHIAAVAASKGTATAKSVRAVLSAMCGMAARQDAIERNPVRDTERLAATARVTKQSFTIEEVIDVRAKVRADELAVSHLLPDLIDMLIITGLRISEACAIEWTDLDLRDLHEATARVGEKTVVREKGKGLSIVPHESDKLTPRTIEIPHWFAERLAKLQVEATSNVVLVSPKGKLRDPSNTNSDHKRFITAAGYEWATPHTYRRTLLTWMDEAGLTARQAADQAGHAHISMTQDRYFGRGRGSTGAKGITGTLGTPTGTPASP